MTAGGFIWAVLAPFLWRKQRRKAQLALDANSPAATSSEFDIIDGG